MRDYKADDEAAKEYGLDVFEDGVVKEKKDAGDIACVLIVLAAAVAVLVLAVSAAIKTLFF